MTTRKTTSTHMDAPASTKIRFDPRTTALAVIDMLVGFGDNHEGELPVTGAYSILLGINRLIRNDYVGVVVYEADCHPPEHESFARYGVHCVRGTRGAQFMDGLYIRPNSIIWYKGMRRNRDSMSGWASDNSLGGVRLDTGLDDQLQAINVEIILFVGLTGEHCVPANVRDALARGYIVYVVRDLVKFVNPEVADKIYTELAALGAIIITLDQIEE